MSASSYSVKRLEPRYFQQVIDLCRSVYPESPPWTPTQLESHLRVFPEGQMVAVDDATGAVVGYAASLIIFWQDYEVSASWRLFTDAGMFTNHDPVQGRTLYGAEIMVGPDLQGRGIGKLLYVEREKLLRRLGLLRIRAGARLRGYGAVADRMTPHDYVRAVVRGEITDATLTFQLRRDFKVIDVVSGYLRFDAESQGYAAIIEYLNPEVATAEDYAKQGRRAIL